jgi:ribosomal protein S18 acetylase RimI-like enzyme
MKREAQMPIVVRMLDRDEAHVLGRVDPDVFDGPLQDDLVREFLQDPRHHIAVAVDDGSTVVGMASGVHFVHPDKRAQLFVNEVGVAASHQGQGIGLRLMAELLAHGRRIGCSEGWVATETDNSAARALYRKAGGKEAPEAIVMYTFDLAAPASEDGAG